MRAGRRLIILATAPVLVMCAQVAHGDDAQTLAGVAHSPAHVTEIADRGTSIQETPTLPPPPAQLPPATTPYNEDRNNVRLDWLEIPPDSGAGRRVVYSKTLQRVWMIEEDETLYNTHRVSGRMDQPNPGTYAVYSKSPVTCSNKHPDICMRWMVRFAKARSGDNIGFHEIPRQNGVPLQTEEKLGAPLSGGCVRQGTDDAILMWDWAGIGTVVVVLA
jgi:hypothetical protein